MDVVGRFAHMWKTGVVVTALLVTVVACGNDDASRARNSALVAGTSCTKLGQVSKISKVSVVCAKTTTGNIWYPTIKSRGRSVSCAKPGAIRKKKAVVWVCGVSKGKKLWRATAPLPPAVLQAAAAVEPGTAEAAPLLESTNVATPSQPVVADSDVLANPAIPDEPPVTAPSNAPETTTPLVTVPQTTPPTSAAIAPISYKVGDIGPGGGIIFYVNKENPAGSTYFEAACAGWSDGACGGSDLSDPQPQWGCSGANLSNAGGVAIGTGEQNTTSIVNGCSSTGIAARIADDLVLGGQSDWFLPSFNEMKEMYLQKEAIGGFFGKGYWSSSQDGVDTSRRLGFGRAAEGTSPKTYTHFVRPVRTF